MHGLNIHWLLQEENSPPKKSVKVSIECYKEKKKICAAKFQIKILTEQYLSFIAFIVMVIQIKIQLYLLLFSLFLSLSLSLSQSVNVNILLFDTGQL